jgi:hypothetical protein
MKKKIDLEQQFFDDPALDRVFGVVMALATEVYVLRDRQREMEKSLTKQGILETEQLNQEPTEEERMENRHDRQAFVHHLMDHVSGKKASKGLT